MPIGGKALEKLWSEMLDHARKHAWTHIHNSPEFIEKFEKEWEVFSKSELKPKVPSSS